MKRKSKWTLEKLKEAAASYPSRSAFKKGNSAAYQACQNMGVLDICCSHMKVLYRPKGYWTLEKLKDTAAQYSSRITFQKGNSAAYKACQVAGLLDICCSHMEYLQRPNGYWNLEKLEKIATQYPSRSAFMKESSAAYTACQKMGVLDIVCKNMKRLRKPKGYWTLPILKEEASKYNSRKEFRKNNLAAYTACKRRGLLDICCSHMERLHKPNGYWILPRLIEEASKYSSRKEFQKGSCSAYSVARREGILDTICSHMERLQRPKRYWTLSRLIEEAGKYSSRKEFARGSASAYSTAWTKGVLDVCCKHMKRQFGLAKRGIYAFEFKNDKVCYIGLTYDFDRRYIAHTQKKGPVFDYIKQHDGVAFEFKKLSEYVDQDNAISLEAEAIEKYKLEGWLCLNRQVAGGLGGKRSQWNREKCLKEALLYNTRTQFQQGSRSAYESARKNKWLDDVTGHMPKRVLRLSKWDTLEKVKAAGFTYRSRFKFWQEMPGAYDSARRHGWMDILFPKQ